MSRVYIFNVSSSGVKYIVNGTTLASVPGAESTTHYTPHSVSTSFQKYPDSTVFGYGINSFESVFFDVISGEKPHHFFEITIPLDVSLESNLILYVFRRVIHLMDQRGRPVIEDGFTLFEKQEESYSVQ